MGDERMTRVVSALHLGLSRLLKYWFRFPKSTAETVAYPLGVSKKLLVARFEQSKILRPGLLGGISAAC